ncbi:bacteriohemerythrin [Pseudodesulfovibrio piezophilus]|uniref:Methyl-accepting chemotaxis sensory transducer n=1 Tax=Pseudodesulfovibrio piezophilus (strain DSM 21447 / JCM 15486 / C1TLV30) TaxID=1322246 RepID=M1WSS9_PSEP2|nr:bacteriohemerythrin [Pseudodesulfovibrio piezophilus]CCH50359.1 Methyl-accepting chemotaxis sensory transducer [Pseudodesulfovibrio piezophilus C1TLV30]
MKIKYRLVGSVFLIFLIIVGMFTATWIVTSSQRNDSLVINLAGRQRMLSQKLAKETLAFGSNPSEALKEQTHSTIEVFEATLSALKESGSAPLTLDPAGTKAVLPKASVAVHGQLVKVKSLWDQYKKHVENGLDSGSPEVLTLTSQSVEVLKAMNTAVVMMQAESEGRVVTLLVTQGVCVGIGVLLVLLVLFFLNTKVTTPLSNLQAFSGAIARNDLDAQIEGTYTEELLALKESIQTMVGNLKAKMQEVAEKGDQAEKNAAQAQRAVSESETKQKQIQELLESMSTAAAKASEISRNVAASVSELASQVDDVSQGTDVQRDRMAETATAMEEMNATVLEVAHNASNAANSAAQARQNAQTGADGVRAAVTSIDAIRVQILDLNDSMSQLGEQAESIGNIMDVVSDIADQTNLLALNAAIEAARAGDAGRGFAVVADEVRKLAEKTMQATKEVGNAVHTIQEQARSNITAVESSVKDIVKSTEAATESGRFMNEIVSIVGETAGMVESIAAASEEQSAASEEINQAVADVTHVATQTAEGMTQASRSLDAMAAMASDLDLVIRDMSGESNAMLNANIKTLEQIESELKADGLQMSNRRGLHATDPKGMMQWTDDLSTNIREIDEQHIRLIDLINALHKAMSEGKGKGVLSSILDDLKDYTVFHFSNEESMFEEHGYPQTENHMKAHKMFVDKVISFEQKILSGKASVTLEVLDFLKDWLVKHIKGVDQQYSAFFNRKGIY